MSNKRITAKAKITYTNSTGNTVAFPSNYLPQTYTTDSTHYYPAYINDNTYNPWMPTEEYYTYEYEPIDRESIMAGDNYKFNFDDLKFEDIIQVKDADKEGIFKNGCLYKANYKIPSIYFDVNILEEENIDILSGNVPLLCLESEVYIIQTAPLIKRKLNIKTGVVEEKNLNRMWVTRFLVCERTVTFIWYENAEILTRHTELPYPSSKWFREIKHKKTKKR
jgi:hypothetical protein